MEIKLLKKERDGLSEAADPILQIAFQDGPEEGVPSAWQERLKLVPDRLKAQLKQTAMTATVQASAVTTPMTTLKRIQPPSRARATTRALRTVERAVSFMPSMPLIVARRPNRV